MATHLHGRRRTREEREPVVLCDRCGGSSLAGSTVLYDRWAMHAACASFAAWFDAGERQKAEQDPVYAQAIRDARRRTIQHEGEYSSSATIVRRYFGFDAPSGGCRPARGESLVRGEP